MRLPLRLTVSRLMIGVATLAVSWAMCLGIGHLSIYRANVEGERYDRNIAATLKQENKQDLAAEWLARADEVGRLNRESRKYIFTFLSLIASGLIAGGMRLAIGGRLGKRALARLGLATTFAAAFQTIAVIMLVGLAIAGVAYAVGLAFVILTAE